MGSKDTALMILMLRPSLEILELKKKKKNLSHDQFTFKVNGRMQLDALSRSAVSGVSSCRATISSESGDIIHPTLSPNES